MSTTRTPFRRRILCLFLSVIFVVSMACAFSVNAHAETIILMASFYDDGFDWMSTNEFMGFTCDCTYLSFVATCEDDANGNPQTDNLVLHIDDISPSALNSLALPFKANGSVYTTSCFLPAGTPYLIYVTGTAGIVKDYCEVVFTTNF